jgi:hypothetical protein
MGHWPGAGQHALNGFRTRCPDQTTDLFHQGALDWFFAKDEASDGNDDD